MAQRQITGIPLDRGQPVEPTRVGFLDNQEQLVNDLNKHSALHCASSSYASAAKKSSKVSKYTKTIQAKKQIGMYIHKHSNK